MDLLSKTNTKYLILNVKYKNPITYVLYLGYIDAIEQVWAHGEKVVLAACDANA